MSGAIEYFQFVLAPQMLIGLVVFVTFFADVAAAGADADASGAEACANAAVANRPATRAAISLLIL